MKEIDIILRQIGSIFVTTGVRVREIRRICCLRPLKNDKGRVITNERARVRCVSTFSYVTKYDEPAAQIDHFVVLSGGDERRTASVSFLSIRRIVASISSRRSLERLNLSVYGFKS